VFVAFVGARHAKNNVSGMTIAIPRKIATLDVASTKKFKTAFPLLRQVFQIHNRSFVGNIPPILAAPATSHKITFDISPSHSQSRIGYLFSG
jgi:hypothetical protein